VSIHVHWHNARALVEDYGTPKQQQWKFKQIMILKSSFNYRVFVTCCLRKQFTFTGNGYTL